MGKAHIWITKFITDKEWNDYYSHNSVYTHITRVKGGHRIGFLMPGNKVPNGCLEANREEIEKIKQWRESNNIYPLPNSILAI